VLENKVIITNESNKNKIYEKSKNKWIIELDGSKINSWDDFYKIIQKEIDICNELGKLHIQLAINEPKAFDSMLAHYGKFSNVKNYIAMIGKKSSNFEIASQKDSDVWV